MITIRNGDPVSARRTRGAEDPQRPEHAPGDAHHRLLVADEDVSSGQEPEQLPVAPQVSPIVKLRAVRLDD